MKRIGLFMITNFSVMLIIGILLAIMGIKSRNLLELIALATITGFGGSLISLFLSKNMALKSVGGKTIIKPSDETEQWLMETVSKQAKKMRISMPQVAIYPAEDLNAFTTGAHHNDSLIAVSSGLLKDMKKEEVEAVLAHEMTHISNGDMVTMTLLQGIANTFVFFISHSLNRFIYSGNRNYIPNNPFTPTIYPNYFGTVVVAILQSAVGFIATIITMWFSRKREFYADAGAAKLAGREKMIAALQRLKSSDIEPPKALTTLRPFCINGGKKNNTVTLLFKSHPSLEQRIKALRTLKYRQ
ncbi:MAG: protease HtpX [Candidatus Dasytiphilus stammeri]